MRFSHSIAVLGVLLSTIAPAHEPAGPQFRVAELPVPDSLAAGCLAGYAKSPSIERINDFGVVNAVFTCYKSVDVAAQILEYQSGAFVATPWFGAVALPPPEVGFNFSYSINNRGDIFGYENIATGGFLGTRWTLAGGHERLFYDPACENIQFTAAVDGNGRYTVGWGLRGDPSLPPPIDTLCISTRWLIRSTATGVETSGPLYGSPTAINAFDVAVGASSGSAIRYHVPTGTQRVLHAADSAHHAEATDINDLGEVVGRTMLSPDLAPLCATGIAVRWRPDGREIPLPHLPGAVASHAFGVGYDGEVVGDSGAGSYCADHPDNSLERAVLWKNDRAFDLNALIPRSTGITLTYAFSVNRRGQITANGYVNSEPLSQCAVNLPDPATGFSVLTVVPCHNTHMYLLTPQGR